MSALSANASRYAKTSRYDARRSGRSGGSSGSETGSGSACVDASFFAHVLALKYIARFRRLSLNSAFLFNHSSSTFPDLRRFREVGCSQNFGEGQNRKLTGIIVFARPSAGTDRPGVTCPYLRLRANLRHRERDARRWLSARRRRTDESASLSLSLRRWPRLLFPEPSYNPPRRRQRKCL